MRLPDVRIMPLAKEHLDAAVRLVAARYRDERLLNSLLLPKYESPSAVTPLLKYRFEGQMGVAAVRGGDIIGFMTGFPYISNGLPAVWVPDWGHGADASERGRVYPRMYSSLAQQWVAKGYIKHAVMTLAHERDVLNFLFMDGFGMTNVDALRGIRPLSVAVKSISIRQAQPDDLETLLDFRKSLAIHLTATPVFLLFTRAEVFEKGAADFRRQLSDPDAAIWLACEGERAIGCMRVVPSNQCDFRMPISGPTFCAISMAFTEEAYRNQGVATALLDRVLKWAGEKGYSHCAVDFESANTPAFEFWNAHFETVCYTLVRVIDARMAQIDRTGDQPWMD